MPYPYKEPDADTLIAERGATKLYAELADCPLYANVRLISPGAVGKRFSFWLGWLIEQKRWAHGGDYFKLPPALLKWAAEKVAEVYPNLETATGCTPEEIKLIKVEQDLKRRKYAGRK